MSNNTEKAILEAAEAEFLAKGFDSARTISIAESAGVTHSMLHYYFRTKEQLFARVMSEKISFITDSILAPFGNPDLPLIERLKKGISNHFDFLVANPLIPRFAMNEIANMKNHQMKMDDETKKRLDFLKDSLQKAIDESAMKGDTVQIDATTLMIDIVSLNVFPFVAFPLIETLLGSIGDKNEFLEKRKAENIETIIRRLKK